MKAGTENGLGAANILCLPCTACPGLDSFGSFYRFTVYGMIDDDSDSLSSNNNKNKQHMKDTTSGQNNSSDNSRSTEATITLAKDSADILLAPGGNLVQNLIVEESATALSAQVKDTLR